MSEVARALGVGNQVEWKGKVYELAPFKWKLIAKFEQWVKQRAWSEIESDRGSVGEDLYRERHNAISKLIASQSYKRGGQMFADSMTSWEGLRYIVWLRISENDPTFTQAMAVEMFDELGEDLLNKMAEQDGSLDEKKGVPAQEAKTSPSSPSAPS